MEPISRPGGNVREPRVRPRRDACLDEALAVALNSGFQRTETGDHFIPRLNGLGDGGGFVLARRRNCGAELPADGTDHSVDDFVTPIRRAAGTATHIGFGATGAISLSHDSVYAMRVSMRIQKLPVEAFIEYTFEACILHFKGVAPATRGDRDHTGRIG